MTHAEEVGIVSVMTNTLHAHVSTASRDCDGRHGLDYVAQFNDDEIAEQESANGVNDFSEINFMNRVFTNNCGPYGVEFGSRITVTEAGFEWSEQTDEGYRSGGVRWCRDAECVTPDGGPVTFYDEYAQMMGY